MNLLDITLYPKFKHLSSFNVLEKEEAFMQCSSVSLEVAKSTGLNLWIFLGFTGEMLNPASQITRDHPIWLGHVVCRFEDVIVDFTAKQFGDSYPHGPFIPISEVNRFWAKSLPWEPGWVPSTKWLRNNIGIAPNYTITDN